MKKILILFVSIWWLSNCYATQLLIPMDARQTNHLKAYGIAYWTLENGLTIEWLLKVVTQPAFNDIPLYLYTGGSD